MQPQLIFFPLWRRWVQFQGWIDTIIVCRAAAPAPKFYHGALWFGVKLFCWLAAADIGEGGAESAQFEGKEFCLLIPTSWVVFFVGSTRFFVVPLRGSALCRHRNFCLKSVDWPKRLLLVSGPSDTIFPLLATLFSRWIFRGDPWNEYRRVHLGKRDPYQPRTPKSDSLASLMGRATISVLSKVW